MYGIEFRDRPYDYDTAMAKAPPAYRSGLMVLDSQLFSLPTRQTLIDFSARQRLPTMYHVRFYPDGGGLISYGVSFTKLFRRAADFVDKIGKGANPSTLPVEQPTRYELVANLASRLCDLAGDAQILVDQDTAAHLNGEFRTTPLGVRDLKGFGSAYPVFAVTRG